MKESVCSDDSDSLKYEYKTSISQEETIETKNIKIIENTEIEYK
jgi:hypothetical protein